MWSEGCEQRAFTTTSPATPTCTNPDWSPGQSGWKVIVIITGNNQCDVREKFWGEGGREVERSEPIDRDKKS